MSLAVSSERWCPSLFDSDVIQCIKMFLGSAWRFFTKTDVPGLGFSFAALFVGAALIPISLSFLSLIFGFPVGTADNAEELASRGSRRLRLPPARKDDVR